jgi:hypothetical protein
MKGNVYSNVDTARVLKDTSGFSESPVHEAEGGEHEETARIAELYTEVYAEKVSNVYRGPKAVPGSSIQLLPRAAIIVDEWGPYDWERPKLYPADSSHELPLRLRVLGPPGTWRTVSTRGVQSLSVFPGEGHNSAEGAPTNGAPTDRPSGAAGYMGDTLSVTPYGDSTGDWNVTLEYRGISKVSVNGFRPGSGDRQLFSYDRFEPPIAWDIRFFTWDSTSNPETHYADFTMLLRKEPLLRRRSTRLDYEGYRPIIQELPQAQFAFEATGTATLAPGTYTLRTISDDGVKVWVDGELLIDDWKVHGSTLDYATLTGGQHKLRVQYFQGDGWMEFRLDILKGVSRSPGSPE